MDDERAKRISSLRASLGTFSDFSQNNDLDEVEDPITAYFKKRCDSISKLSFKISSGTGSDSSVGLIDLDNVSLFDVEEENGLENSMLSDNMDQLTSEMNVQKNKKSNAPPAESELDKQRTLAQKALGRLSNKCNENKNEQSTLTSEKKESKALNEISSKLMNIKLSGADEKGRNWLEPNFSPNTPRQFNDELSSFGGEYESLPIKTDVKDLVKDQSNKERESLYTKTVSSLLKEHVIMNSDLEFKPETKEEQINRFEEDEKKFKHETSYISHNSRISEFSGVVESDISQWPINGSNPKLEAQGKNLSIGQFFTMRSNRISSLVGTLDEKNSVPSLEKEMEKTIINPTEAKEISKSESAFPIVDTPLPEKPKFRRFASTCNLKGTPEIAKNLRYSNDSCSSNSTAMIQDILAEMESGLSGTQIYEKLMKSYGRREKEGKELKKHEKLKKNTENIETPKSSKVPKKKDFKKNIKRDQSPQGSSKESKNFCAQSSGLPFDEEFKENEPVHDTSLNRSISLIRKEKASKPKAGKGFCASTPKTQALKSQNDNFKTDCGKILMNSENWEAPRVNSIQPTIDLNKSEISEENDKTVTVNSTITSSEFNKKNGTILINDTLTIEDTIVAGDLTVLSQRIDEMKQDSVCIVRSAEPKEPVLLTVIQKLADLPKGTVDCSALTPLLRDQFPELLSSFPTPSDDSSVHFIPKTTKKVQEAFLTLPGSWVKLPGALGLKEKVYACADLQRTILVPVLNISQNWLLISLHSVELVHPQGKRLSGVKRNNEWSVLDFVVVSLKETIITPNNRQSLKVLFKSKVSTKLELMMILDIKELMSGEVQTRSLRIVIHNVHPENYINVIPKDPINFGVIADQCFDQRTVQISFDGICELPLTVYIEEDESISGHFILKPYNSHQQDEDNSNKLFHHVFHEGDKQVLEFRVFFQPNILLKEDSKTQDFKAELVLMLGSKTDTDGILRKIPVKGSVGFAKFLCSPSCTPLVFRASEKGQSVSRSFPLKNVGSLPIAFSVWIINKDGKTEEEDDMFVVPKSFYLSRNEEAAINVTFKASTSQNCTKRYMMFQIKPNGRAIYDVELIGIITTPEGKPRSRPSSISASTKSTANSESVPIKLLTTTHALSWTAIPLEKEARQTFQIKSLSSVTTSVRVTFKRNTNAFKLVNENGEKVHKMRKVLKPDCPCIITVVFRPDVVGTHHTSLIFESNHSSHKKMVVYDKCLAPLLRTYAFVNDNGRDDYDCLITKIPAELELSGNRILFNARTTGMILLNGIGGIPNLYMGNVKPDLNGCKILRLQHSRVSNQFENSITVRNEGRIPGFLLFKPGMKDFSLSHELTITPSSVVVSPDSSVTIKISQKLKNDDLQQLLSDKEISKVATVCVLMGDEPSRLRIKKMVETEKFQTSERLKIFTTPFHGEQPMHLKSFKDPLSFEAEFLKSLRVYEVAVVVERNAEICEPSILEETADEFVTFISAHENTVISTGKSKKKKEMEFCSGQPISDFSDPFDISATFFPVEALKTSHKRVTKWLETLDCL